MRSIFALVLPLVLLAGCASPAPAAPPPEDPVQKNPPASTSTADTQDGTLFEQELSVTVDGGRTLTLVAHCKETAMEGFSTYGTGSIDVLDGETPLQTLDVGEAIRALNGGEATASEEVYPTLFESFYLPTMEDLNFDGAQDILCMYTMGTVNGSYLCWLWDPALGQFTAGPELCGYAVEADPEEQQVSVSSRGGWGNYDTDIYVPDERGALVLVKRIHKEPPEDASGELKTTVQVLTDGQWTEVTE